MPEGCVGRRSLDVMLLLFAIQRTLTLQLEHFRSHLHTVRSVVVVVIVHRAHDAEDRVEIALRRDDGHSKREVNCLQLLSNRNVTL